MYWVVPMLKTFNIGRDSQDNSVHKPYMIEDVQK